MLRRLREMLDGLRGRREDGDQGGAVVEHDRTGLAYGEQEPMKPAGTERDARFDKEHDRVRVERPGQG